MKDDKERLLDIEEAIERIEKYAFQGRKAFENNELVQNWIVHHLQIIGEATRSLSSQWSKIIGMRNILVHDYFGIDVDVIWKAVERDLPELKQKIKSLLKEKN